MAPISATALAILTWVCVLIVLAVLVYLVSLVVTDVRRPGTGPGS